MSEEAERQGRISAAVARLLTLFPTAADSSSAEDRVAVYLAVAQKFEPADVEAGVMAIFEGRLSGFDGRFRPTPTQLALAIRQVIDARPNSKWRRVPEALAAPEIAHDAESRARVKARVEAFVASARAGQAGEAEAAGERARALAEKVAQRFDPPQDAASLSERLARRRASAGAAR